MVKLLLSIVLSFFLLCTQNTQFIRKDDIVVYENYSKKINIPSEVIEHLLGKKMFIKKNKFNACTDKNIGIKITDPLFDILLNQDIINRWSAYKGSFNDVKEEDYKTYISEKRKELRINYLGELQYEKAYKSLFFQITEDNSVSINNKIILINIKDYKIIAAVELATSFFGSLSTMCNSSKVDKRKVWIYESESSGDIDEKTKVIYFSKFIFNKDGLFKYQP